MTTLLVGHQYKPSEAGLIVSVGVFGMLLSAVFAYLLGERLERKLWLLISAILTILGGVLIGLAGANLAGAMIGALILFFGENLWVPIFYAWTTENFPARARTSGFAIVDGVGHVGAGVGLWLIAPVIPSLGVMKGFLAIAAFLLLAALIALFGINARGRVLEEVSP